MIRLDIRKEETEKRAEAKSLGARWNGTYWYVPDNKDWRKFVKWIPKETLKKLSDVRELSFNQIFEDFSNTISIPRPSASYLIKADIQSIYETSKGTLICNLISNYEKVNPILRIILDKNIQFPTKMELENKRVEVRGELDLYRPSAQLHLKAKSINILGDCSRLEKISEWEKECEDILFSDEDTKNEDFHFSVNVPAVIGLIAGKKSNNGYKDFMKEIRTNPEITISIPQDTPEGVMSAEYMTAAIREFNEKANCKCICIVRGGGDPDQMMDFSKPLLLRAIAESKIPVITGVGHSDDKLLCKRVKTAYDAGTPTGAAKKLLDGLKMLRANKSQCKSNYFQKKDYNNKESPFIDEINHWINKCTEKEAKILELEQEIERLKKKNTSGLFSTLLSKLIG